RGHDHTISRMHKLQVHPAPNEGFFEQGAAPGGTIYVHLDQLGAEHRVTTNQRVTVFTVDHGASPILRVDLQHRATWQIAQVHAALDLRLNDVAIDLIAQMWARPKQVRARDFKVKRVAGSHWSRSEQFEGRRLPRAIAA